MQDLLVDNQENLAIITQAYLLVRYGELSESDRDLEAVEIAWQQVSDAGHKLKLPPGKGKGAR
jgi:hypothetical protein